MSPPPPLTTQKTFLSRITLTFLLLVIWQPSPPYQIIPYNTIRGGIRRRWRREEVLKSYSPSIPRSKVQGPKVSGSQRPRYLKVAFKYEIDSKEGPSCINIVIRIRFRFKFQLQSILMSYCTLHQTFLQKRPPIHQYLPKNQILLSRSSFRI